MKLGVTKTLKTFSYTPQPSVPPERDHVKEVDCANAAKPHSADQTANSKSRTVLRSAFYNVTMHSEHQLNEMIEAAGQGDRMALDRLVPGLYEQLRQLAAVQMQNERSGHLLQTTAIVHEAYFRLSEQKRSRWRDKSSFFAAAAVVMRRVLIDCARREMAMKRGGTTARQQLSESRLAIDDRGYSTVEIHEALERLGEFAPEQAKAIEMMIFGGMTGEEVAQTLRVSASTIDRRVRAAKAWLRRELSDLA